jgi:hypothetical protein
LLQVAFYDNFKNSFIINIKNYSKNED